MIESAADRAELLREEADLALFAAIPDVPDTDGQLSVIVERNVLGLFDRSYVNVNGHEAFHPVFLVVDEDAKHLKQHHRIMVKGQVWTVDERMPDGTGFTQLHIKLIGPYHLNNEDENVMLGYPYTFPIVFGMHVQRTLVKDDENPPLNYPYTIGTYMDSNTNAVTL